MSLRPSIAALVCLCLASSFIAGCGDKPDAAAAPAKKSGNAAAAAAPQPVSVNTAAAALATSSVFVADSDIVPDPFFPKAKKAPPQAASGSQSSAQGAQPTAAPATPATALLVQQILGSGARRVALINDQVLEPGRSAMVTLANGQRWKVFCVRIADDSVTVRVEGQGDREVTLPAPRRSNR